MREIVTVKAYVCAAARHFDILDLLYVAADALGNGHATAADADEHDIFNTLVLFDYLVGYSHECTVHCGLIHEPCLELHIFTSATKKALPKTDKTHNIYDRAQRSYTISAILPVSLYRYLKIFSCIL